MPRIVPKLGAGHFQTYGIHAPLSSHWRPATCDEVDCPAYLHGWVTVLPAGDDRAALLKESGRHFVEYQDHLPVEIAACMPGFDPEHPAPKELGPGLVAYWFEAGQACFRAPEHRVLVGRPELFVVRGGDFRGNPAGIPTRTHTRPEHWVEDFAEHQDNLARLIEGG